MKLRKLNAYLYVGTVQMQKALAYRFNVFSNIVLQCIVMFASAYFWRALYSEKSTVQGAGLEDMLTYTVISTMMFILLSIDVEGRVTQSIRKGTIATDIMKPADIYGIYLFEDIGNSIVYIFQNAIPVLIIACLFIQIPKPHNAACLVLFLLTFVMGYIINWLFAAIFSMISFYVINTMYLREAKKHIIRLLSGSIIPLWFFPEWLQNILYLFPFTYIYQMPLDIYIGRCDTATIQRTIMVQLFWCVFLFIAFTYCKNRVLKKVMVQGG